MLHPRGAAVAPPRGCTCARPESLFQRQQHPQIPLLEQSWCPCRRCGVGDDNSLHLGQSLCPAPALGQPWHSPAPLQDRDTGQGTGASMAMAWTSDRARAGGPITTQVQLFLPNTHQPQGKQTQNTSSTCSINYTAERTAAPHALLDLPRSSARILPLQHSTNSCPAPVHSCLHASITDGGGCMQPFQVGGGLGMNLSCFCTSQSCWGQSAGGGDVL